MAVSAERKSVESDALEWFGILTGPIAWLTQFEINYAMVRWECIDKTRVGLHVVSLISLLIVLTAGGVSYYYMRKTREESAASEKLSARRHFMAALGMFSATLYSLAIIMQAIPSFLLDPCQR